MIDAPEESEPARQRRRPEANPNALVFWADPSSLITPADLTALRDLLSSALAHLGVRGEVRVRIVDDPTMAAAHQRYSGIAGTTDVLTFDLREPATPTVPLDVDVMVCIDEARRQAAIRGHDPRHELLLYALHGVMHCLGHDDHDDAAYERMHAAEDAVLDAIGVGRIFARPPAIAGQIGHGGHA